MAGSGRFFPYVGISLGSANSFDTFNEQTLNASGSGPYLGQLGMVVEQDSKCYRLVKFNNGTGNVAAIVGGAAHWKDRDSFEVTSDQSDAQASLNSIAGAFISIPTDAYYCFLQMGGKQAVVTDTTCSAGAALIGTTTDLTLVATTTNTKGDQLVYAVSYGTNSTTSANAFWLLGNLL
jgi:hypothetical protein